MIGQPLNKNCPVCGGYVYITDIGTEICQNCGYVIPLATFASVGLSIKSSSSATLTTTP